MSFQIIQLVGNLHMLILILEMSRLLYICRKNRKKLYFCIKYKHQQCGIPLKKVNPFNFRFCPSNVYGRVISEDINSNSTVSDCFFYALIQNDLVWYSQTCIRRPILRPLKSGRLGQVVVL